MTDAEKAYERARELIAKAKAGGATRLSFESDDMRALAALPPEIAELAGLRILDLDKTQVSDLTPLSGLTGLTELRLNSTPVSDLTPLSGLTGLTVLGLDFTPVSDLTPLSGLTGLTVLHLNDTSVSDLTPLSGLSGLTELRLESTLVSDLTPLSGLFGLTLLWLHATSVSDLTPLSGLSELTDLWLSATSVSDLTPLSGLSGLTDLWMNDTPINDLTPLSGLSGLAQLRLDGTQVRDLRPTRLLRELVEAPGILGLTFTASLATKEDPRIAEISEIEDNAERARALFEYLEDWEPPEEAAKQGGADASPLPPQPRLAPLQADIQAGRLVRAGRNGLPKTDPLVRAEAGWRALRVYRETFGSAFNLHNHHPLGAFLDAFDQAMGDRFDPENSILIGAMSGGIVALAGDKEFCGQLPAGAEPLLRQFAAQVQTYLNRFPDWTAYQHDAAGSEDNTASAAESFVALDGDLQASPDTDRDVAEIYDMQVRAALNPESAEATRKGLVASTGEVTRALAEKALDEVRSGQAVRGYIGSMDKVHDGEAAKVGWYAGGFAVVFFQRRQKHFRHLATTYPQRMGWLHGVLDYLFGPERD